MDQMDGRTYKEKMIYFLEDGQNFKINEIELMQKNWKELEHVISCSKRRILFAEDGKEDWKPLLHYRRSAYKSMKNLSLST